MSAKGLKRVCIDCRTPFYDFNKRPIICPQCQAEIKGLNNTPAPQPAIEEEKPAVLVAEESSPSENATVSLDEIKEEEDDDIDEEELMRIEEDLDLDSIDDHLEEED